MLEPSQCNYVHFREFYIFQDIKIFVIYLFEIRLPIFATR